MVTDDTSGLKGSDKHEREGLYLFSSLFILVLMGVVAQVLRASLGNFIIGFTPGCH